MRYIKTYEDVNDKLKKYIEFNVLNLITILQIIDETTKTIKVKKLYTYDTINKKLSKNDEVPTVLIYDNFTKECIVKQSNNLKDLIMPLELEQDTNKYNL